MGLYTKVLKKAVRDKTFRTHAFKEGWELLREYLPARLTTPRRDYVFCRYSNQPSSVKPKGKWLPPHALHFRIAAYGILYDANGHVLLVSNPALGFNWNLPGGGVRRDETLEQGLIREFEEETGLIVKPGKIIAVKEDFLIMPTRQAVHAFHHYYTVEVAGGELLPHGNGLDTSRVAFVDFAKAKSREFHDYELFRELFASFN
jgi:ADP-ribose pyrophosphatase YjhB (NUDIX family)